MDVATRVVFVVAALAAAWSVWRRPAWSTVLGAATAVLVLYLGAVYPWTFAWFFALPLATGAAAAQRHPWPFAACCGVLGIVTLWNTALLL
jgi:hypothetical protein